MNIKNPFGLRNNKIVHINEISREERGLKANCLCPSCHKPLLAVLGNKQIHHFRHYDADCGKALESALHLYAKEIIKKYKRIKIPPLLIDLYETINKHLINSDLTRNSHSINHLDFIEKEISNNFIKIFSDLNNYYNIVSKTNLKNTEIYYSIQKAKTIYFNNALLEYNKFDDFIPDIFIQKYRLAIEIKVSHKVDSIKLKKLKKENIPVIEIDLSNLSKNILSDRLELRNFILYNTENKTWLYNPTKNKLNYIFKNRVKDFIKSQKEVIKNIEKEKQKVKENRKKKIKSRVKRINKYLKKEVQQQQRKKWAERLEKEQKWINLTKELKINKDNIPPYLNKKIDNDTMIKCDRRLWQVLIFRVFIYKRLKKTNSPLLQVKHIVDYIKRKTNLPLNKSLIFTRDLYPYHIDKRIGLDWVIGKFMLNLEEYGFLEMIDGPDNTPYYWWFKRLKDDLELNPLKEKKINADYFHSNNELNKKSYKKKSKNKANKKSNSHNHFKKNSFEFLRKEALIDKKKNSEGVWRDSQNNRWGNCRICDTFTKDWVYFFGEDNTCECYECHEKKKKER